MSAAPNHEESDKVMKNWQIRTMSPAQYKRAIEQLGLNKAQAGRFLGVSTRTSHRYFDGDTVIPPAHAMLLRVMVELGDAPIVPRQAPIVPPWQRGDN